MNNKKEDLLLTLRRAIAAACVEANNARNHLLTIAGSQEEVQHTAAIESWSYAQISEELKKIYVSHTTFEGVRHLVRGAIQTYVKADTAEEVTDLLKKRMEGTDLVATKFSELYTLWNHLGETGWERYLAESAEQFCNIVTAVAVKEAGAGSLKKMDLE